MSANDPITLEEACQMVFHGKIRPATLRAEAARGNLEIARIGRRHFTTLQSARELFDKCRVEQKGHASTSKEPGSSGLSETERASSALAALRESASRLKRNSPATSPKSTNRRVGQTH